MVIIPSLTLPSCDENANIFFLFTTLDEIANILLLIYHT